MDKHTGNSKGYGFVTFAEAADAAKAVANANPMIDGKVCNCNLASLKQAVSAPPNKGKRKQMNMNMVPNMPHAQNWSWPNDNWWATNAGNGWDNGAALWSAWGWNPMGYDMYSVPPDAHHQAAYAAHAAHVAQSQQQPQQYAPPLPEAEPAKKKPRLDATLTSSNSKLPPPQPSETSAVPSTSTTSANTAAPSTTADTTSPTNSTSAPTTQPSGMPTTTATNSAPSGETDPNLDEMQQAYQYMAQQDDSKAKLNPFSAPSFVAKLIEKGVDCSVETVSAQIDKLSAENPPEALKYYLEMSEIFVNTPKGEYYSEGLVQLARHYRKTGEIKLELMGKQVN